jgi:hypothetical protein
MSYFRRSHRLPLLLLLAAGLATGAACGGSGSGSNNGVASIKTASDKSSDSETDGKDKDTNDKKNPEDAMLEFARCMRENGVDMPDPDTSGGPGVVTFRAGGAASAGTKIDADGGTFQKAHEACKDLMGDVGPMNMTPEQQQEMQDQALAFSRCMREHGIDMPDPNFGEGGQVMMRLDKATAFDPSDPKFEEAQKACGSAFGPAGAKGGPGLSVGGGKVDGGKGEKSGAIMFGAPSASVSGGAK